MLVHSFYASQKNGKLVRDNVKFIFVFSGADYERISKEWCRNFGGVKEGMEALREICDGGNYTCCVIDIWKRNTIRRATCYDYMFSYKPDLIEVEDIKFAEDKP